MVEAQAQIDSGRAATRGAGGANQNTPVFRGAALEAQRVTSDEWVISGPSETGKTWGSLWRLDHELRTTRKAQAALLRKVRETITGTVLVTYKRVIERSGSGAKEYGGQKPQWYDYPNGARLWIGGMDDPGKVLSGERDFIYVNQAEELNEADWETLSTRATGRGAVTETPMLFGDCNPGPEDHWVIRRRDSGALRLLESKHEDNPSLFDDDGRITAQGIRSIAKLDKLTGVRFLRLRRGLWVGAEGQYFDQLDENVHVLPEPIERPQQSWGVWGALDYGFHHPLAFGVFAQDPSGCVYMLGRHVEHKWYIAQHADAMGSLLDALSIDKHGLRIVAGHDCWATSKDDPETIADKFAKHGFHLERATISRIIGARAVGERLGNPVCDPPVAPTLLFNPSCRTTFLALSRMVHDPRKTEDVLKVNADAEGRGGDDEYDMVRYAVMAARAPIKIHRPQHKKPNIWKGV